ncbi:hypothetical protein CTheo_2264 [Ceratobasidium theobromae]|uniref:Uncharacterized protein n=1 Tax=Ceratobasidium theobromae TaxID=1582974 RepID=A0A5N5QRK1_9AGAM|nr:hypothetical protein CTheo_2264 [Ceratobasidium theobromae]
MPHFSHIGYVPSGDVHLPDCFFHMLGPPSVVGCICNPLAAAQLEKTLEEDLMAAIAAIPLEVSQPAPVLEDPKAIEYIVIPDSPELVASCPTFSPNPYPTPISLFDSTPSPPSNPTTPPTPYSLKSSPQYTPELTSSPQIPSSVGPARRPRQTRRSRRAYDQEGFTIIMVSPEEAARPAGQRRAGKAANSPNRRKTSSTPEKPVKPSTPKKRMTKEKAAPAIEPSFKPCNLGARRQQVVPLDLPAEPAPVFPLLPPSTLTHIPEFDRLLMNPVSSPFQMGQWTAIY